MHAYYFADKRRKSLWKIKFSVGNDCEVLNGEILLGVFGIILVSFAKMNKGYFSLNSL